MSSVAYEEKLKQDFMKQAGSVFERVMAENGNGEGVTLSQIEEKVGDLRFELTSRLVESKLKLEVNKQQGPAAKCEGCDREMRDKGLKKRTILTSQGEIKLERRYNYCPHCRQGFFPPGSATEA
jgi:Zn finger protein HypA/HybF involved in hydrogenase expression